jgi:hypothetical protein
MTKSHSEPKVTLSTYEEHLEKNQKEWEVCARRRHANYMRSMEIYRQGGCASGIPRVWMENWLAACETVVAYQKARGKEPCVMELLKPPSSASS